MLSSLTIILPSMTTFLCVCVFAALNGYYLFLFILYRNVFVLFYPFLCCYLCYFFRLYVFFCMSLLSISFIPCLWFPFLCVSVFM